MTIRPNSNHLTSNQLPLLSQTRFPTLPSSTAKKVALQASTLIGAALGTSLSLRATATLLDDYFPVPLSSATPLSFSLTVTTLIYFSALGGAIGGLIGRVTLASFF
ncbi:MAG: hypothetical protein FJZ59_02415 [Chlamydiae bacterium]|nr:hypothetical protein [Chlamydiota bacterium]